MQGWIETKNPGVFSGTSSDDIIVRTSTLSGNLVLGNSSRMTAGMYIAGNNVGVRCVPDADRALDVCGNVRFGGPAAFSSSASVLGAWTTTLTFDQSTGLSFAAGSSNLFSLTSKKLTLSSSSAADGMMMGDDGNTMPVQLTYDGFASCHAAVAKHFFKVSRWMQNVSIVRVVVAVSPLVGVRVDFTAATVSEADLHGVEHVWLQDHILRVHRVEAFGPDLHVECSLLATSSTVKLARGLADLCLLDDTLMRHDRFGALTSKSITDDCTLSSVSAAVHASPVQQLSIKYGLSTKLSRGWEGRLVTLDLDEPHAPDFERVNVFRVVGVTADVVALSHVDNVSQITDCYPGIVASLVGFSGIKVRLTQVATVSGFPSATVRLQGVRVSYQTNKVVFDVTPAVEQYVNEAPTHAVRRVLLRRAAVAGAPLLATDAERELFSLECTSTQIVSRKVVVSILPPRQTVLLTGDFDVELVLTGSPIRILAATYNKDCITLRVADPMDALASTLLAGGPGCRQPPHLYVVGRDAATLFSIKRVWTAVMDRCLELAFANVADAARHVPLVADDVVSVFAFAKKQIELLSSATDVAFDRTVGINTTDVMDVSLAVGGDCRMDGALQLRSGPSGPLTELRADPVEDKLHLRAVDVAGKLTARAIDTPGFSLTEAGVGTGAASVNDAFYKTVYTLSVPANPARRFLQRYDYDVGMFVSYLDLEAQAGVPRGARVAFVNGVRFNVRSSGASSSQGPGTMLYVEMTGREISQQDEQQLFDASRLFDVCFVEDITEVAQPGDDGALMSLKLVADAAVANMSTVRIVADVGEETILAYTGKLCVLAIWDPSLQQAATAVKPRNAFVLQSCTPSVPGVFSSHVWTLDFELIYCDRDPRAFVDLARAGAKMFVHLLDCPLASGITVQETVGGIAFNVTPQGENSIAFTPGSRTGITPSPDGSQIATLSLMPDLGATEVLRYHPRKILLDPATRTVRLVLADLSPRQFFQTASSTIVQYTVRGAPVTVVAATVVGDYGLLCRLHILDRFMLTVDDVVSYVDETVFLFGMPWRVKGARATEAMFDVVLSLTRLSPQSEVADVAKLSLDAARVHYILPCRWNRSRILRSSEIAATSLTIDAIHTLRSQEGNLIIDDLISIPLSADPYIRCFKDVYVQGNLVAECMSHTSDRIFKTDIRRRAPEADLDLIKSLNIYDYTFLDRTQQKQQKGVIAEELDALAVQDIEGFVPNVYSKAFFNGGYLVIQGRHPAVQAGSSIQLRPASGDNAQWISTSVTAVFFADASTPPVPTPTPDPLDSTSTSTSTSTSSSSSSSSSSSNPTPTTCAVVTNLQKLLANQEYFVYGTWTNYKVANTTHLLMTCINAVKALAQERGDGP